MPSPVLQPGTKPATSAAAETSDRRLYITLFAIGLAMRLGLMLWKRTYMATWDTSQPFSFGMEAGSIAQHLARGMGFSSPFGVESGPTAWLAPVYPCFVAAVFKLFGIYTTSSRIVILAVNSVFGAATALTLHRLGLRTVGRRPATLAAVAWATFPIFYRWAITWVWEFALSAFLLTLVLLATLNVIEKGTRRRWLVFGALWGLVALTNPALLSLLPVTGLYAAFGLQRERRPWFQSAAMSALLFFAILAPMMVRNYKVFHQPVFLRGNFWFEFHLGNYHASNGYGFRGKHPSANPLEMARFLRLGEVGYIAWAKQESLGFVREYPQEFLALTMKRTYDFWSGGMLPYQDPRTEWWQPWEYWPLSALGLLGVILLFTRRPKYWFLIAAVPLVYPLPYYLTYPVAKYRHAIEPELVLAGAFLLATLWDEFQCVRKTRRFALKLHIN